MKKKEIIKIIILLLNIIENYHFMVNDNNIQINKNQNNLIIQNANDLIPINNNKENNININNINNINNITILIIRIITLI